MNRIVILTEAGPKHGYGHLTRCTAIGIAARTAGIECKLLVAEAQGPFLPSGVEIKEWRSINFLGEYLQATDRVILDAYSVDDGILRYVHGSVELVCFIDDFYRTSYPGGLILNPSLMVKDGHPMYRNATRVLGGKDYILLRPEFIGVRHHGLKKDVEDILIIMGATDIRNIVPTLSSIIACRFPGLKIHAIMSADPAVQSKASEGIIIHRQLDANGMAKLLSEMDLVVTAAGQTIHELIHMKVPFIPVEVIENQHNNMKAMKTMGLVQHELAYGLENLHERIIDYIEESLIMESRRTQVMRMDGLIDGKGAFRVIQAIEQGRT